MRVLSIFAVVVFCSRALAADVAPVPRVLERAAVESSLATATTHIRQYAFDTDANTYFASDKPATKDDHFTLRFEGAVKVKALTVLTGKPNGDDALAAGALEVSDDGTKFEKVADFTKGKATADLNERAVRAVRVRPTEDLKHPLVVREIAVDSAPRLTVFRYPVEFTIDVTDAPELREWTEKVVRVCEREYPMICDILASDDFRPPTQIRMSMKSSYNGVAMAGGNRITGSVKYFKERPNDIGAMVHETAHCVQSYRARGLPGWLVEGIADYVRFWKFEPGTAGRVNPQRAAFDASYRTTAAFLAYVSNKYDPHAVTKLNAQLRAGKYDVNVWKTLTGKTVEELNKEWRETLR